MMSAIPGNLCCFFFMLNRCNSFSHYRTSLKEEESQKIDDLHVLATCRSGTSVMLSSEVSNPFAHG